MPLNRRELLMGSAATTALGVPLFTSRSPAIAQTPEAQSDSTLLDMTFLRDWQPGGKAQGAFYRIILEPGQTLTYLPGPYCGCSGETIKEGTAAEVVISGSYAISLDRPFIVRRADGVDEDVDPDTEVTLTDGDAAIYPDALAFGDLRNDGTEPITIFGASITSLDRDEGTFTPELPEEMSTRLSVAIYDAWKTLGDGDIDAVIGRRILEPGSSPDPYPIERLESIHVEAGELDSSTIPPGETRPVGDPRYISTGGTVAFRQYTPGTQRLLENSFEAPATLITLTFRGSTA
ncbi:hypothetical protein BH23CHL5_BH23CHL5_13270 [soil metagenome]